MNADKVINSYEDLFNLEEFQKLKEKLKNAEENNIFKILNLQNYEIRHSRYLTWLLDPNQPHGLGTAFLEKLFKKLGVKDDSISFNHIEVYTEYPVPTDEKYKKKGYIDILIEADDFVCVIENKYGSREHDKQCKRYKKFVVDNKYGKFENKTPIFIYLDIFTSQSANELEGYKIVTYKTILEILNEFEIKDNFHNQVLAQYRNIIEVNYSECQAEYYKSILSEPGVIDVLLKELKYDENFSDNCNTVYQIQTYMWDVALTKANELIRGIYDELKTEFKFELNGEDGKYVTGNYGVYRCILKDAPQKNIFISISNNLRYKDWDNYGINVFIVDNSKNKWEKISGINLIRKEVFFNKVLKNDGEDILDNYIEKINNIIKKYDQIIKKKQNLKSMT